MNRVMPQKWPRPNATRCLPAMPWSSDGRLEVAVSADFGECQGNLLQVALVQAGHAHAPAVDQVHAELLTQTRDLLDTEPGVAEHSFLLYEMLEVPLGHRLLEYRHQLLAHVHDAHAH